MVGDDGSRHGFWNDFRDAPGASGGGVPSREPPNGNTAAVPGLLSRRSILDGAARLGTALSLGPLFAHGASAQEPPPPQPPFTFAAVIERARRLAETPYSEPTDALPDALRAIDPAAYRAIRFRPDRALWLQEGLPFRVEFFHRGPLYRPRAAINVVDGGQVYAVGFSPQLFDYATDRLDPADLPADLGFAGFRLHFPVNRPDTFDEVAAFPGGGGFRGVGRGQVYGVSARGLVVDAGRGRDAGFPPFTEFWIVKPAPEATAVTVLALLDGPGVAGAFRFEIRPGDATVFDTDARLFPRDALAGFGLAPLSTLFAWGENTRKTADDFRPELHDSDGLMLAARGGEWVWRPLTHPDAPSLSSFPAPDPPSGFGLLQRDRSFDSYQDLDAVFQLRPSAWVEPLEEWGAGAVGLAERPVEGEVADNVLAFWTPEAAAPAREERRHRYRLHFALDLAGRPPAGHVVGTRSGPGDAPGRRRYFVDYAGGRLDSLGVDAPVEAVVSVSAGEVASFRTAYNGFNTTWRATFDFDPRTTRAADLRCFLRLGEDILTETWTYPWRPD